MRIGIDGSDIGGGGGLTFIAEVLRAAQPQTHGVCRVILWGSAKTLAGIDERPWLEKVHEPLLEGSFPVRRLWQRAALKKRAQQKGCDLLFCPGGCYRGSFRPFVALYQDLPPFQHRPARRLGISFERLELIFSGRSQAFALKAANGMIYLSEHAARTITARMGATIPYAVIPQGINEDFFIAPRVHRRIENCSDAGPLRILQVSTTPAHRHQWGVAQAVARLRREGLPVTLDMVGPAYRPSMRRLRGVLGKADQAGMFIRCLGPVPRSMLPSVYRHAELFVYASSCENMPSILLEAMASGLPIACSDRGPMPEMLSDAGLYFNPESSEQIAGAVRKLILDRGRRRECSELAYRYAGSYRWERSAHETFAFLCKSACDPVRQIQVHAK